VQLAGRSDGAMFVAATVVEGTEEFVDPAAEWLPDPIDEQAARRPAATPNPAEMDVMPRRVPKGIVFILSGFSRHEASLGITDVGSGEPGR